MSTLDLFKFNLKNISEENTTFQYTLGEGYFSDMDDDIVRQGKVNIRLNVKKSGKTFELNFLIKGILVVPCDRCLDDMELQIKTENKLTVKWGETNSVEDEEIVMIPENESIVDLSEFIHDYIILSIPVRHVHAPGLCDQDMMDKLKEHMTGSLKGSDYKENKKIDPRWDALKNITELNNDN